MGLETLCGKFKSANFDLILMGFKLNIQKFGEILNFFF